MTTTRAKACTGKVAHATKQDALAMVRRRKAARAPSWTVQPYRCKHCGTWHVGHRPKHR